MREPIPRKLYDFRFSGNSYKVRLALNQLGLKVETVSVDILAGDTQTPEFLRMNPMGQIPVLELSDASCLRESNAILFWLASGTDLMPSSVQEQTDVLTWMFFEQSNIDQVLGRSRFLRAFPGFRTPSPHEWQEWYRVGNRALSILDDHLCDKKYLVGDKYSIADIALYGYVHTANEGGFELDSFTNIAGWLRTIETTEGYISQMDGEYP